FDRSVRSRVRERFEQVVRGTASAFGARAAIHWIEGPPPVRNDARLAKLAEAVAAELGLRAGVPVPSAAGADLAAYQAQVPERVEPVVRGTASAAGARAPLHWREGPRPVRHDARLARLAEAVAAELGLRAVVPVPSAAGEDFAVYQEQVPGLFVFAGTNGPQE